MVAHVVASMGKDSTVAVVPLLFGQKMDTDKRWSRRWRRAMGDGASTQTTSLSMYRTVPQSTVLWTSVSYRAVGLPYDHGTGVHCLTNLPVSAEKVVGDVGHIALFPTDIDFDIGIDMNMADLT